MASRMRIYFSRIVAVMLLLSMLTVDASAVVKEVAVYGVRSINDEGNSDNRITLEQLIEDYQDFDQTDTLREYFHKDQEEPSKVDLSEALSYLIDNEIINRDNVITVTGMDSGTRMPVVSIEKKEVSELNSQLVTRSDAIMYIYKAAFGPIDARTIGLETDNIRVDDGTKKTLYQMMLDHDYFTTINRVPNSIIQSESTGGQQNVSQSCVTTPQGHYDSQYVSSQGGIAGQQTLGYAGNINSKATWRYSPQGQKVESIFGDTNIFISNNNIAQQGSTGPGTQGLGIGSSTGESSPDIGVDVTGPETNFNGGGPTQAGNHNAQQSEWAGTGGLNQAIAIETDYKQIYYAPGADLMFYRTNDVLEIYIKAALSKGLLEHDRSLRTDKFNAVFIDGIKDSAVDTWSPSAPAYIVNRSSNKLMTAANVKNGQLSEVLGVNFNVFYHSNNFTLTRERLFQNNSGYFTTERVYKMDLYRYIYRFISANEKKLSDLETEIVNYKYGMELDGVAKNDEDTQILMYLIAKGIIDFDNTEDLTDLYQMVTYEQFLPVLYRVASPNARLDFSKIQLTDSETSWKAKGYAPQSTYIVPGSTPSSIQMKPNPELFVEKQENPNGADSEESDAPLAIPTSVSISFTGEGEAVGSTATPEEILSMVATNATKAGDRVIQQVNLGAFDYGEVAVGGQFGDLVPIGGYTLLPVGAMLSTSSDGFDFKGAIKNAELLCYNQAADSYGKRLISTGCGSLYNSENFLSLLRAELTNNLWAISILRSDATLRNEVYKAFDAVIADRIGDKEESKLSARELASINAMRLLRNELYNNVETTTSEGLTGPKADSLKFSLVNPVTGQTETWTSLSDSKAPKNPVERAAYFFKNIRAVEYIIVDSEGKEQPVSLTVDPAAFSAKTADGIKTEGAMISVEQKVVGSSSEGMEGLGDEMITAVTDMLTDVASDVASKTGSLGSQNAASTGSKVTQFVQGKEGFLSWSQIVQFNGTKTSTNETIQIERVSDLTLWNKQTDTRAYFSVGSDATALVGTAVVKGDPALGVAFKDGSGASTEYYYHIDAIRLLMNAKQESSVLSGLRGTALADQAVQENLQNIPLQTDSGHVESSLIGLKVLISSNDKDDRVSANGGDTNGPYFKGTSVEYNTRWGRYISLSQANRAINAISRRITYQPKGTQLTVTAYAVVIFEPADIEEMGSAKVVEGMSMQDILDAAVQPPTTQAGIEAYNQNKTLANAFANWIYGTTGKNLVETGYLVPKAYLYVPEGQVTSNIPATVKGSLTDEQFRQVYMSSYASMAGYVCKLDQKVTQANGEVDAKYKATYAISNDYRVMIAGDRVYLSESCCTNLTYHKGTGDPYYLTTNSTMRAASFQVGNTFKLAYTQNVSDAENGGGGGVTLPKWIQDLRGTVIETKSDGTIVAQVGPIPGTPIRWGSRSGVFDSTTFVSSDGSSELMTWKSSMIGDAGEYGRPGQDRLAYVKQNVIAKYRSIDIDAVKICVSPMIDISKYTPFIYTNPVLRIYSEPKAGGTALRGKVESNYTVPDFSKQGANTFSNMYSSMNKHVDYTGKSINSTNTYLTMEFSAFKFTIRGGMLTYSDASAADFLSPSLFTNLNDLIINEMMNESNGAIPINEVPADSLLKIGNGYFMSHGTNDNREFIGYAHLMNSTTGAFTPHLQDVAKSFADHYIRGGSQYINVTHFFSECDLLPSMERQLTSERKKALEAVADATLRSDNNKKLAIYPDGSSANIHAPTGAEPGAYLYTPVSISFQDALLAYPSGKAGSAQYEVYTICADAKNSVNGAFEDLPFFTDAIMEDSLLDITTDVISASWKPFAGDYNLMNAIKTEFEAAFKGDLFTLARMLIFIVLIWLVVASWVCYGFYVGNLMPIIDAIKHPTRDRGTKGIDLFKVMSLGTISVDTDFRLGRFIQYDAILAVLICIVWKSGSITIF